MKTILIIIKSPLLWRIMLSVTVFLVLREMKAIHKETARIRSNQSLMQQQQKELVLSNGRTAAQTGVLMLHQAELHELFPELQNDISLLKVKMSNVSAVSTVAFTQQKQLITRLTDSISIIPFIGGRVRDTALRPTDTLRYKIFRHHDEYYDVSGIAHDGQQLVSISSTDTMTQVVYRRRKNPWLWIFSPKVLEQRVYFRNPNAHIHYSRTLNITR